MPSRGHDPGARQDAECVPRGLTLCIPAAYGVSAFLEGCHERAAAQGYGWVLLAV